MSELRTPIYNTPEEAFEAEMGFPISEASQNDYNSAEDNLFSAVSELVSPVRELDKLIDAGFDELAEKLRALCAANMAMDCAKEHL
ncbi:hypothetical protein [Alteromonas antoniana]|jgi:hypothetical protein|uniref:hypothetical protein n=1 Tax=Alteromonas antoniana TaxID=2803813 RepID=UPI001C48249C|nr:hypothetical protein [Alteromonas antoniana]|tara:strand:+ start:2698 stop:2955 length:258 start_codon:yes stop_codon:yes gene_type:complete